jgi:hypothetical protein
MKTQVTFTQKLWYVAFLFMAVVAFSPMQAQSNSATQGKIIKGVVSSAEGPLDGANVILKGANEGVVTNKKGEFTFPVALKPGDVLKVTYLGYQTVEIKITESTNFLTITMSDDVVEFMGDLNTNQRYKSKRKN